MKKDQTIKHVMNQGNIIAWLIQAILKYLNFAAIADVRFVTTAKECVHHVLNVLTDIILTQKVSALTAPSVTASTAIHPEPAPSVNPHTLFSTTATVSTARTFRTAKNVVYSPWFVPSAKINTKLIPPTAAVCGHLRRTKRRKRKEKEEKRRKGRGKKKRRKGREKKKRREGGEKKLGKE